MDPHEQPPSESPLEGRNPSFAPLPDEFDLLVKLLKSPGITFITGSPGSGKTFWANAALSEVQAADESSVIVRLSGSNDLRIRKAVDEICNQVGIETPTKTGQIDESLILHDVLDYFFDHKKHLYIFIDDIEANPKAESAAHTFSLKHPYLHVLVATSNLKRVSPWSFQYEGRAIKIPEVSSSRQEPALLQSMSVFVEPGSSSAADIAEFFSALADLQRACGGFGITIRDGESKVYCSAPSFT